MASKSPFDELLDGLGFPSDRRFVRFNSVTFSYPAQGEPLRGIILPIIGNFDTFETVNLWKNKITGKIPDDIGKLTNLTKLNLSDNCLTGPIPQSMSNLQRLSNLQLAGNKLTGEISSAFLGILGKITDICSLPPGLKLTNNIDASHFQGIEKLKLRNLHFEGPLPSSILQLSHLETLDLRGNNFADKSYRTLAYLPNDMTIMVDEPYYKRFGTPKEIKDLPAVLQRVRFEDAITEPKPQPGEKRTKVLFLGPGMAGKTTLINRLCTGSFDPSSPFTDGVEMKHLRRNQHVFYMWDLSGQDVYFATHSLFFSDDAIYVIVVNVREHTNISAYYESIKAHAKHPNQIIIVSTRASENVNTRPVTDFLDTLSSPPVHISIDSNTGHNIEHLITKLTEACDNLTRLQSEAEITQNYLILYSQLQTMKDKFALTRRDIHNIGAGIPMAPDDVDKMLDCYRKWGLVHLIANDFYVLDPKELADVLARVVTKANDPSVANGVLQHDDIHKIWDTFSADLRNVLLKLLHDNQIAFEIISSDTRSGRSIVPAMLPEFPTVNIDKEIGNGITSKPLELTLTTGNALPLAFIPTLMSRVHRYIVTKKMWRNGFVMADRTAATSMAAVYETENRTKLVIQFYGSLKCQALLANAIRTLLDTRFADLDLRATLTFASNVFDDHKIRDRLLTSTEMPGVDESGKSITIALQHIAVILGIDVPIAADNINIAVNPQDKIPSSLSPSLARLYRKCELCKQHHNDESDRISVVVELLKCVREINQLQNLTNIHVLAFAFEDVSSSRNVIVGFVTPQQQLSAEFVVTKLTTSPNIAINANAILSDHSKLIDNALRIVGVVNASTFLGLCDLSFFNQQLMQLQYDEFCQVDSEIGQKIYKHSTHAKTTADHLEEILVTHLKHFHDSLVDRIDKTFVNVTEVLNSLSLKMADLSVTLVNDNQNKSLTLKELKALAQEFESRMLVATDNALKTAQLNFHTVVSDSARDIINEIRNKSNASSQELQNLKHTLLNEIANTNSTTVTMLTDMQNRLDSLQNSSRQIDSRIEEFFDKIPAVTTVDPNIFVTNITMMEALIQQLASNGALFINEIQQIKERIFEQKEMLSDIQSSQAAMKAKQDEMASEMHELEETLDSQRKAILKKLEEVIKSQGTLTQRQEDHAASVQKMYNDIVSGQMPLPTSPEFKEIKDMFQRMEEIHSMVRTLISNTHGIPTMCILIPERSRTLDPWALGFKTYRLFFVCGHTKRLACSGKAGKGYHVRVSRDWLKRASPVIRFSLAIVKTVISLYGIPLPIPDFQGENELGVTDYCKHAEHYEKELAQDMDIPEIDVDVNKYLKDLDAQETRSAYEAIRTLLMETKDPTLQFTGLTQMTARGVTKWIWNLDEVKDSFALSDQATQEAHNAVYNKAKEIFDKLKEAGSKTFAAQFSSFMTGSTKADVNAPPPPPPSTTSASAPVLPPPPPQAQSSSLFSTSSMFGSKKNKNSSGNSNP